MPIRMVDDPGGQDDYNPQNDNAGSGGGGFNFPGGGGGGLLNFLPLIFSLFGRGGKGSMLLIVVIAAGFFLLKSKSCTGLTDTISKFATGGKLDPEQFKKASVYEGLADDGDKNPLPESVSLLRFAPSRMNQGKQGSCVAWSSAYAAHTILEASSSESDPNRTAFSPAFLYNNIGLDDCQGSYIIRAMEFMQKTGSVSMQEFPYDDNDCSRQPNQSVTADAAAHRIHGFTRLTNDDGVTALNFRAIKEHLAKDAPVVIGMMVGGSFMQDMMGQKVWHPENSDYSQMGFGGHAMCVIGYDDRIEGGAFQIMNSWGTEWGINGTAFIRYSDFRRFVKEAYGLDPLAKQGNALRIDFECNIGLVNTETKEYIPIKTNGGNLFTTINPIEKGTRFKLEVKNARPCYVYIFGEEKDQSSYVLFPYKPIHSPYFGITGYRLFPRKESLMADSIGNKDQMAVMVSKTPLDYAALNTAINKSNGSTYLAKIMDAIGQNAISRVKYNTTATGNIYFKANASEEKNIVACVVELNKF